MNQVNYSSQRGVILFFVVKRLMLILVSSTYKKYQKSPYTNLYDDNVSVPYYSYRDLCELTSVL